jgi:glycosyltransferase involved in cell wall biosynthesis
MKINIITEHRRNADFQGILRRASEELANNIPNAEINGSNGDINYFINYATYKDLGGIPIAHFTHLEDKGFFRDVFFMVAQKVKHATCTCDITYNLLRKEDIKHIYKIPYGSNNRLEKPIYFGVVGSTKKSGRKGEHLVGKMIEEGFNVYAWGEGWGDCHYIHNTWDGLPSFYKLIDYLVVTSLVEGGPVPVVDAIRAGVPVIAPDVGWCWEYPVIKYDKGNWDSLKTVLDKLTKPPTWNDWIEGHKRMFEGVK